jgi:hypothetical protein
MRVSWVTVRMMLVRAGSCLERGTDKYLLQDAMKLHARVLSSGLVGFTMNGRASNGGVSRSYLERGIDRYFGQDMTK